MWVFTFSVTSLFPLFGDFKYSAGCIVLIPNVCRKCTQNGNGTGHSIFDGKHVCRLVVVVKQWWSSREPPYWSFKEKTSLILCIHYHGCDKSFTSRNLNSCKNLHDLKNPFLWLWRYWLVSPPLILQQSPEKFEDQFKSNGR